MNDNKETVNLPLEIIRSIGEVFLKYDDIPTSEKIIATQIAFQSFMATVEEFIRVQQGDEK